MMTLKKLLINFYVLQQGHTTSQHDLSEFIWDHQKLRVCTYRKMCRKQVLYCGILVGASNHMPKYERN